MKLNVVRPNGFSEIELATLGIWFVAVGRWDHMDFSVVEAQAFVLHFFKCLQGNPKDGVRASYLSLQNTFMAMRKSTFESIQAEPPFSRSGRRTMNALLEAWLGGGEAELRGRWREILDSGSRARVQQDEPIRVVVRSGDSPENAIQVLTDYAEDKVNAEYWFLYYEYGRGWKCETQMSTIPDAKGQRYDILDIHFQDGQKRRVHFLL